MSKQINRGKYFVNPKNRTKRHMISVNKRNRQCINISLIPKHMENINWRE